LHISGHDRLGRPLAIQRLRRDQMAAPEIVMYLPHYLPDGYAVLPERGLMLHVQVHADGGNPLLQLAISRGQQSSPLLQREITDTTSLTLGDLTFNLDPSQVPLLQASHQPTRPLMWVGLGFAMVGLVLGFVRALSAAWIQMEETEDGIRLCMWGVFPVALGSANLREACERLGSARTSGAVS
jgi:hypothetical protein